MSGGPWEDFKEEDKNAPWMEYQEKGLEQGQFGSNPMMSIAAPILQTIGELSESYLDAPTRAGIGSLQKDVTDPMAALGAAWQQFGADPSLAPSGKQIAESAGLPGAMGFPIEMAASPTNLLPIGGAIKMIRGTAKQVKPISQALKEAGSEKALKQVGAMKRDFKELAKKKQLVPLGEFALKEKVVGIGSDIESALEKSSAIADSAGKEIQRIYKESNINIPPIGKEEVISPILERLTNSFKGEEIGLKEAFDKLAPFIQENIANKERSLSELWNIRKEIDGKINFARTSQEMPSVQKGYRAIRDGINDLLQAKISEFSGSIGGKNAVKLKEANKKFSQAAKLEQIGTDRSAQLMANRQFSPTDYGMGGLGGVGTMIAGGDPATAMMVGAGLGMANKAARTYGPGLQASGLMRAGKMARPFDRLTDFLRKYPGVSAYPGALGSRAYNIRQKALEDKE